VRKNAFFCFTNSNALLLLDGADIAPNGDIVNQTAQTEESRLLTQKKSVCVCVCVYLYKRERHSSNRDGNCSTVIHSLSSYQLSVKD
jgi:hypothetical protein